MSASENTTNIIFKKSCLFYRTSLLITIIALMLLQIFCYLFSIHFKVKYIISAPLLSTNKTTKRCVPFHILMHSFLFFHFFLYKMACISTFIDVLYCAILSNLHNQIVTKLMHIYGRINNNLTCFHKALRCFT